ncbi:unnamed protein product, partial [Amoebophrya sp. A120]
FGNLYTTPVDVIAPTFPNATRITIKNNANGKTTFLSVHRNPHNLGSFNSMASVNDYPRLDQAFYDVALSDQEQEWEIVTKSRNTVASPIDHYYYLFHPETKLFLHVKPEFLYCSSEHVFDGFKNETEPTVVQNCTTYMRDNTTLTASDYHFAMIDLDKNFRVNTEHQT